MLLVLLRVFVDWRQIPQVRLQLDESNDSSYNNADGDIWSASHQDGRHNAMPSLDPIKRTQIANTLTVDNPGVKTNRRGSFLAARDVRFRSLADVTDAKLVGVRDKFAGHSLGLPTMLCKYYAVIIIIANVHYKLGSCSQAQVTPGLRPGYDPAATEKCWNRGQIYDGREGPSYRR